jgi:hypothetical protein
LNCRDLAFYTKGRAGFIACGGVKAGVSML